MRAPALFCVLLLTAGVAMAQPARNASDGIYTAAQADRGNAAYQQSCAVCHGGVLQGEEENPPLSGKHFDTRWGGKPVSALYGFINSQMPLGAAGSLGTATEADIVAYILQVNKFPAGQAELPPDSNIQGTITINKQK